MTTRLFGFAGGDAGRWQVLSMNTLAGEPLASVRALDVLEGSTSLP